MMKRLIWALPSTLVLAFLETVVAIAASFCLSGPLARQTGAALDPARLVAGLVETESIGELGALLRASAIGLALLGAFVVLEPFVFVLFVRNHELPSRRGPMHLDRRAGRIVLARLVGAIATAIVIGLALALGNAATVALASIGDPRARDLVHLGLGLLAASATIYALLVVELAGIRLSIRPDGTLESLLEGHRALDRRTLALRLGLFVASTLVASLPLAAPSRLGPALVVTGLTLTLRLGLRSVYVAFVVGRLHR